MLLYSFTVILALGVSAVLPAVLPTSDNSPPAVAPAIGVKSSGGGKIDPAIGGSGFTSICVQGGQCAQCLLPQVQIQTVAQLADSPLATCKTGPCAMCSPGSPQMPQGR